MTLFSRKSMIYDPNYSGLGLSFTTLVTSSLGLADFSFGNSTLSADIFSSDQNDLKFITLTAGYAFLLVYLAFAQVMLLNLIIAKMTSTFNKIEGQTLQMWQFNQATILKKYHILYSRSIHGILPPPLNVVVFLLSGFGFFHNIFSKMIGFSVGDCIANYVIW